MAVSYICDHSKRPCVYFSSAMLHVVVRPMTPIQVGACPGHPPVAVTTPQSNQARSPSSPASEVKKTTTTAAIAKQIKTRSLLHHHHPRLLQKTVQAPPLHLSLVALTHTPSHGRSHSI